MKGMHYKTFKFKIDGSSEKDGIGEINGYGSIFNNTDSYGEIVAPNAFAKSLLENGGESILLWQHDSGIPIGKWSGLKENNVGLYGKALLPLDIVSINEKYQLMKAGLVNGLSIGYFVRKNGYTMNSDGTTTLNDLDLREISAVTFPANPLSLIDNVKNNIKFSQSEIIDLLCGLGHQKQDAKIIINKFMNDEELISNENLAMKESLEKLSLTLRGIFTNGNEASN